VSAFDLVVIGGSAGGVDALTTVLAGLPRTFPAPIAVVQHHTGKSDEAILALLNKQSALPVVRARDGESLAAATAYLTPTGRRLLIGRGPRLVLSTGAHTTGSKPAVDALFQSAASVYKSRVIAVVLSGATGEGSAGAVAVKNAGGTVIAQDEATSPCFGMPGATIAKGVVDHVLPVRRIAPALHSLVSSGLYAP
jgi:two-component system chemotaxis response regulator CheB